MWQSKEIVEQARKNLKYQIRAIKYRNARTEIVRGHIEDMDDPRELLAYSMEMRAANRTNDLAEEISRLWIEKVNKR